MMLGWRTPAHHWHVEVQEEDGKRRVTVRDRELAEHEARLEAEGVPKGDGITGDTAVLEAALKWSWTRDRKVKVVACWDRCLGVALTK